MATDYILRSDAVQCANDLSVDLLNDRLDSASYGAQAVAEWLKDIPAADVRSVVRGRWIPVTNGRGGNECSECHCYALSYQSGVECLSNFCPNCGADMREVKVDG